MKEQNIILMGGDGFCGWASSLHLSNLGYNVTIVDNLVRRKIDVDLECDSLTPIQSISKRIETWENLTGKKIRFEKIDISLQYNKILNLIDELKPIAIVHFAEQRAAPMSMKSPYWKRYTINNNLNATHNILCAVAELGVDTHIVHLGTTGYYGYGTAGMDIPEGYLPVKVDTDEGQKEIEIIYPPNPGSIYHLTKVMDAMAFLYYNKNDNLKISDLHQGIVWGCQTKETKIHEDLINRFDWEGDFGTVLNRFLIQSQVGHPLTVHGVGGQTRAFIHIQNTVECIQLAIENPPDPSKVRILNQTTECMNVLNLAKLVSKKTGAEIRYYKNPRKEDDYNDLRFRNDGLINLGLDPITLDEGLLEEIMQIAYKYKYRVDKDKIVCTSLWNKERKLDTVGSNKPIKG